MILRGLSKTLGFKIWQLWREHKVDVSLVIESTKFSYPLPLGRRVGKIVTYTLEAAVQYTHFFFLVNPSLDMCALIFFLTYTIMKPSIRIKVFIPSTERRYNKVYILRDHREMLNWLRHGSVHLCICVVCCWHFSWL